MTIPARILKMPKRRMKIAVRKVVHNRLSKLNIVGHKIDRIALDKVRGAIADVFIHPVAPVERIVIQTTIVA